MHELSSPLTKLFFFVVKNGINNTVKTTLYDFIAPYDILIVGYSGNRIIAIESVSHNEHMPCALTGDIDKIKVMVWSDLSTLKSLCEAQEITSDKFIIE